MSVDEALTYGAIQMKAIEPVTSHVVLIVADAVSFNENTVYDRSKNSCVLEQFCHVVCSLFFFLIA